MWKPNNNVHAYVLKSLQLCPALCHPMDCSPLGSSVHRILQARIIERAAIPSSRGSSQPRDWTRVSYVSCTGWWVLYHTCHLESPSALYQALYLVFNNQIPSQYLSKKWFLFTFSNCLFKTSNFSLCSLSILLPGPLITLWSLLWTLYWIAYLSPLLLAFLEFCLIPLFGTRFSGASFA